MKKNRRGQGMAEYILVVGLIAVLSVVVVLAFGNNIRNLFFESGKVLAEPKAQMDVKNQINQSDANRDGW